MPENRGKRRKMGRRNPPSEYRWKPGQSGNPGGQPKGDVASEIAQDIFEKNPEVICKAMLKALKRGNPKVFSVLADRGFGKLREHIELGGGEDLLAALAEGRKRAAESWKERHRQDRQRFATPGCVFSFVEVKPNRCTVPLRTVGEQRNG